MRIVRENLGPVNVKIAGNACAAHVSLIHIQCAQHRARIIATHRLQAKAFCADSESRILAMKKFSCAETSRLIGARQNRIFARIAEG
jgi:hypothetical protein